MCRFCGTDQPAPPKTNTGPVLVVSACVLGVIYIASLFGERPTPEATEAEEVKVEIPGERCKGYHGEARNFSGLVKERLRNPDSFEHVQTSYGPVKKGMMLATMQYRGTNGFGAIDTRIATGQVMVTDCAARVLTME